MNWITQNLQNALDTWNNRLAEIWGLLSQSPQAFRGGGAWDVIANVHDGLKAIGYALLVLFFLMGVIKTCGSVAELKRPEVAVKMLLRFVLAQAAITYSMDILLAVIRICQGIIVAITGAGGAALGGSLTLPAEIVQAIEDVSFLDSIPLWIVAILASLLVTVLSFVVLLTVYNRFFKVFFHVALAPIPLASFAGEPSSGIGKAFIKSFTASCLEGAIVVVACVVFSALATSPPSITNGAAVNMVWAYTAELIFNLLVLVGAVRLADQTVKGMLGL